MPNIMIDEIAIINSIPTYLNLIGLNLNVMGNLALYTLHV